jgi:hypothetical protein
VAKVIDRDLGYSRIIRNLRDLGRAAQSIEKLPAVFVGVRADTHAVDGTQMALIAAANEFGTADGHVPERSYIRSTLDENREKYLDALSKATGRAVDKGPAVMRTELGKVGARVVADIQRKIVAIKEPPNAPSTIAAKGSANPLIDTGRLRQSIDWEVRGV